MPGRSKFSADGKVFRHGVSIELLGPTSEPTLSEWDPHLLNNCIISYVCRCLFASV
jgi:hypothetical protein